MVPTQSLLYSSLKMHNTINAYILLHTGFVKIDFKAYILNVSVVGFYPLWTVLAEKDELTAYSIYSENRKMH